MFLKYQLFIINKLIKLIYLLVSWLIGLVSYNIIDLSGILFLVSINNLLAYM